MPGGASLLGPAGPVDPAPLLDPGAPVVGEVERLCRLVRLQPRLRRDQCRDGDGQRERVDAGVLLPAVLLAGGAGARDEGRGPAHHVLRAVRQRDPVLAHLRREQDRKARLVELDAGPERLSGGIGVLRPVPVGALGGDQVPQDAGRVIGEPQGDEGEGGQDRIPRPDQVITAQRVGGRPPGRGQRRHQRARVAAILVRLEDDRGVQGRVHHAGGQVLRRARAVRQRGPGLEPGEPGGPVVPLAAEPGAGVVEPGRVGRPGQRLCRHRGFSERQRQHALRLWQHAGQGDVAMLRPIVDPGDAPVTVEVLPAVRRPRESDAGLHEAVPRPQADRGRDRRTRGQQRAVLDPTGHIDPLPVQPGRQDRHQRPGAGDRVADQQRVAVGVWQHFQLQPVGGPASIAFVDHGRERTGRIGAVQPVTALSLEVDPDAAVVLRDKVERQVADARLSGRGPVDLVQHPVADRRPDPPDAQPRGDEVLVGRRPRGRDARAAGGGAGWGIAHDVILRAMMSPTRKALAMMVNVGFTAPIEGKKLASAT